MGVFEGPGSPCAQDLCPMCPRFIDNVLDAVLPSIPVLLGIRKFKMLGPFGLFPRKFKMFRLCRPLHFRSEAQAIPSSIP